MSEISRPATAADIIEIVGPLDAAVLMRIVETQATPAGALEAFTWATADDQNRHRIGIGATRNGCPDLKILKREELEPDER
jgi:hypothetical protein